MSSEKYKLAEDISFLRELLNMSQEELAKALDVSIVSLNKWETGGSSVSEENLEKFYSYAYSKGIGLNAVKEQFYREEISEKESILFHGAKESIEGSIRIDAAKEKNDFGQGFYMGESFRQAALFIANYEKSNVYALSFDPTGLKSEEYHVDQEWLLAIAAFRGKLKDIASEEVIKRIKKKAQKADYIIAPIADNSMYRTIKFFLDGEITDEQCVHSLAATNLGRQYIAMTEKAVSRITILEKCYLCEKEKSKYIEGRREEVLSANNKVRAARIKYRGKGKYIDEIL